MNVNFSQAVGLFVFGGKDCSVEVEQVASTM